MRKRIRIRVPASTSNLGPGFDTLGVALSIANTVDAEATGRGVELEVVGDIPAQLQKPAAEMAVEAVRKMVGQARAPGLRIRFENQVPVARGLGSSATLRLGVLAAVNELLGLQRADAELVQMAAELEGHPDNVAPSFYGGFTVAGFVHERVRFRKFTVSPRLKFVTVVPTLAMETKRARAILPKMVRLGDAVWNMNRTALIVGAFATQDYAALDGLFDDKLHQPRRSRLLTPLFGVIAAARKAGALGAFLSGSGSAIMALALEHEEAIGVAMCERLAKHGIESSVLVLRADNQGIHRG